MRSAPAFDSLNYTANTGKSQHQRRDGEGGMKFYDRVMADRMVSDALWRADAGRQPSMKQEPFRREAKESPGFSRGEDVTE